MGSGKQDRMLAGASPLPRESPDTREPPVLPRSLGVFHANALATPRDKHPAVAGAEPPGVQRAAQDDGDAAMTRRTTVSLSIRKSA